MSRTFLHCQDCVQRLRGVDNINLLLGSRRRDPGALGPRRRPERHNNLSGKQQKPQIRKEMRETPCDLGLCKCEPGAKIAASCIRASSLKYLNNPLPRTCRLGAWRGLPLHSSLATRVRRLDALPI
jgi:hypothetical protein